MYHATRSLFVLCTPQEERQRAPCDAQTVYIPMLLSALFRGSGKLMFNYIKNVKMISQKSRNF